MKKKEVITTYKYSGTNQKGRKIKGELTEKSLSLAKLALKKQGITAKSIHAVPNLKIFPKKKIKDIDITVLARQLATMMKSGVTIIDSFDIIATGITNQALKEIVMDIKGRVESGTTFANALRAHPNQFDDLFCSLVEAGESSGKLEHMLDRIATYKEKNDLIKQKIKKAMKYPITVILASLCVTVLLLLKVIPVFSDLFASFGGELPAFTQMIVNLSEFTQKYWFAGLVIGIGGYIGISRFIRSSIKTQHALQRLHLKMPVFGDLLFKSIIARFTATLSTTFASGVPLIEALESAAKATGNVTYYEAIMDIRSDVTDGQTLNFAMKNSHMFPIMAVQLTAIGEQTGELESMLAKIAVYYESEVDNAVEGLTSMMEPLVMVILGVLIGGLVVAMYLPIFSMGDIM